MGFKDTWKDKVNGVDVVDAADINSIAQAVIEQETTLPTAISDALEAAKNSGAFDGKSAYEYAQDGGFQGTETEFAEKLAFLMGYSVYGYVDADNNIIVSGSLADGTYAVKYEMQNGSTLDIGELELDTKVYYSITNNLTSCTNGNNATRVVQGESYLATISANLGYELETIVVTMGGTDITSSAVSGDNISITEVTGDIVITAVANMAAVLDPVTVDIELTDGIRIGSDGGDRTQKGYCATPHIDLTNIPKPCTINLTKARWCSDGAGSMVRVHATKANGTVILNDTTRTDVGGSYFTVVDNSGIGNDVTVTITSADVGYIRFSAQWSSTEYSDSNVSFAAANTKATLTYTPLA